MATGDDSKRVCLKVALSLLIARDPAWNVLGNLVCLRRGGECSHEFFELNAISSLSEAVKWVARATRTDLWVCLKKLLLRVDETPPTPTTPALSNRHVEHLM